MASILTNAAAMAALQTLRSIDRDLETTQARVSSGMRVETAADNAAYWSIATTMRSDNRALSTVQDALGLGAAKVDTAYAAMESAIEVVKEIKAKLVAAYAVGTDRAKIQEEIAQLQEQLRSIAESASFSGENWLQGVISDGGTPAVEKPILKQVVASFIRSSSGQVAVTTVDYPMDSTSVLFDQGGGKLGILDREVDFLKKNETTVSVEVDDGVDKITTNYAVRNYTDAELTALGPNASSDPRIYEVGAGPTLYLKVAEGSWVEVVTADPAAPDTTTPAYNDGTDDYYVVLTGASDMATRNLGLSVATLDINKLLDLATTMNGMTGGGYTEVDVLDVMTQFVDQQLLAMTSAASGLGSIQSRIQMQESFVASLVDVIDKGVGRLVDADMNEESTRLKALQTQQQLGIQSLSIANTNSENILQLFRQ
ncbi:flagellin [Mycoplana sp. BE70]|uniref:flagellin N-terminal helical domain-containing protein n=1 Tax=Mycoplana sp. BE70 TaxID=2817775 RepID=UPI00285BB165|nr:flagellin [Mycoplana sp. BE70]MDR6754813.1 flagellin [Mycoplana sp. BE70]